MLKRNIPLLVCELILLFSMLVLDRPLIRGDALAYFVWTASIGGDFDMNLENQAEYLGDLNTYMAIRNPQTGYYGNAFAWGQGLLLQPAFQAARLLDRLPAMRVNDDWFHSLQRYPFAYSLLAMLQVNLMTMFSLAMVYAVCRRLGIAALPAACAGLMTAWGTPLLYYSAVQPLYAHASATFAHTAALALFVFNVTAGRSLPWWRWMAAGLAFGLAALTRWQLALSFIPCFLFISWLAAGRERRAAWSHVAAFALGFVALVWHIPYTFNWMFGSPFSTAMGEGFVGPPRFLWEILFSDHRGFFLWSPIALVGIAGLIVGLRRHRSINLTLLGVVVAQILINAGVETWSGGESFGLRRLTELYPALALGAAQILTAGAPAVRRAAYASAVALGLYGVVLVFAALVFGYFTLPAAGYVAEQPADTLTNTLIFFFSPPKFHLIWPMMEHHFGWWAWTMPGP